MYFVPGILIYCTADQSMMNRKNNNCVNCGDFREIVGFGLCLRCYSQKRRDDLKDGIPPFVIGPDESQRRDRQDMAIQRQNLAKILAILEGKPIDDMFLPPDRKRTICSWMIEAINLINGTVSCYDNKENEVVATTEESEPKQKKKRKVTQEPGEPYTFPSNPVAKCGGNRSD